MDAKQLYLNPEIRANDINNAFTDPSIHGIISTIGGTDSARILKYLNIELIKNNPKFLMGFPMLRLLQHTSTKMILLPLMDLQ
jgi:muramoyltetrapeptide carboxypeptidase LdcA involved in peptidoglycan recycling